MSDNLLTAMIRKFITRLVGMAELVAEKPVLRAEIAIIVFETWLAVRVFSGMIRSKPAAPRRIAVNGTRSSLPRPHPTLLNPHLSLSFHQR